VRVEIHLTPEEMASALGLWANQYLLSGSRQGNPPLLPQSASKSLSSRPMLTPLDVPYESTDGRGLQALEVSRTPVAGVPVSAGYQVTAQPDQALSAPVSTSRPSIRALVFMPLTLIGISALGLGALSLMPVGTRQASDSSANKLTPGLTQDAPGFGEVPAFLLGSLKDPQTTAEPPEPATVVEQTELPKFPCVENCQ
jgi:hypothetical protein